MNRKHFDYLCLWVVIITGVSILWTKIASFFGLTGEGSTVVGIIAAFITLGMMAMANSAYYKYQ